MKAYDVVYLLANDVKPQELKYSLRSLCKNFEFDRVIFHGGCPKELKPDLWIDYQQKGATRRERVEDALAAIMSDERIGSRFWLFNDDFFILQKNPPPLTYRGTLEEYARYIEERRGASEYTEHLKDTAKALEGVGNLNYETHTPFFVDREKGRTIISLYTGALFKSAYGNYYHLGGEPINDCKIYDLDTEPGADWPYVTTHDHTFRRGAVGRYLIRTFSRPCKFERYY